MLNEAGPGSAATGNGFALLLPLADGVGELSWRAGDGTVGTRALRFGEVALVGSARNFSLSGDIRCLVMHVSAAEAAEFGGTVESEVVVRHLAELAGDDLVLWETAVRLRGLSKESVPSPSRYINSLVAVFVTHLLGAHARALAAAPPPRGLSPRQLRAVLDFIAANLKEPLTTEAIARQAHLSPFHFTRLFKASTGFTPRRYLLRARVLRARELLLGGDSRVAEAAYAVGFCDQSHLDRHFRRHFGYPPKTLLKLRRAQE